MGLSERDRDRQVRVCRSIASRGKPDEASRAPMLPDDGLLGLLAARDRRAFGGLTRPNHKNRGPVGACKRSGGARWSLFSWARPRFDLVPPVSAALFILFRDYRSNEPLR